MIEQGSSRIVETAAIKIRLHLPAPADPEQAFQSIPSSRYD
jgi:hypothetical protein